MNVFFQTQIYCLVRKSPDVDTKERLRNTLNFYELFKTGCEDKDESLLKVF